MCRRPAFLPRILFQCLGIKGSSESWCGKWKCLLRLLLSRALLHWLTWGRVACLQPMVAYMLTYPTHSIFVCFLSALLLSSLSFMYEMHRPLWIVLVNPVCHYRLYERILVTSCQEVNCVFYSCHKYLHNFVFSFVGQRNKCRLWTRVNDLPCLLV